MVDYFIRKIKDGIITIDKVPKLWRAKVQAELDKENGVE